MSKKIYRIEPILEERVWGGQKIREKFKYESDLENIAQVYHVIAIPNHLDNKVIDTGENLSEFYHRNPELFNCSCKDLPVRMVTACAKDNLSLHMHPDDEYALAHEGMRGKLEGGVALTESDNVGELILGHNAQTIEEFKQWTNEKAWDKLFRKVKIKQGDYLDVPIGTLHGESGDGTEIQLAFSTNGDVTYRLYDYERNDPNRPLHIEQIFETVNIPDDTILPYHVEPVERDGCLVYDYYAKPGAYVGKRVKVEDFGSYELDQFMFALCADGEGTIDGLAVKPGGTVFIPAGYGKLALKGKLDLFILSYRD